MLRGRSGSCDSRLRCAVNCPSSWLGCCLSQRQDEKKVFDHRPLHVTSVFLFCFPVFMHVFLLAFVLPAFRWAFMAVQG